MGIGWVPEMYPGRVLASLDAETVGRTKFERVCQFGCTDHEFGRVNSKHWRPIRFRNFVSNLANEIQASASK